MKIWRLSCHWKLHFIIWIFLFEIVLLNATKRDHYLALILVATQFCGRLMQISLTSPERWFLHTNSDILSTNQSHCEVCMVDGLLNRRMMHLTFTGPNFPLNTTLALTQDVCMHAPMHLFCMWAHNVCPTLTQAVYLLQGTVTPPVGGAYHNREGEVKWQLEKSKLNWAWIALLWLTEFFLLELQCRHKLACGSTTMRSRDERNFPQLNQ